jgi:protein MYSM1
MDFHAHLAHTEIIGLLGGNFIQRDSTKILQVKLVFPCQSTSTGIQCEMDPASEMKAREVFAEKGFNVVGWYHSHPTFEPHPSIRDIENQTSYQVKLTLSEYNASNALIDLI